jgi:hypothetical protein
MFETLAVEVTNKGSISYDSWAQSFQLILRCDFSPDSMHSRFPQQFSRIHRTALRSLHGSFSNFGRDGLETHSRIMDKHERVHRFGEWRQDLHHRELTKESARERRCYCSLNRGQ